MSEEQSGNGAPLGPFDSRWIAAVLPHRYPLLLVDRVLELVPGRRVVAVKNVTRNEPFFDGHFPGNPIMPGVLVIEAMAQTAALLLLHEMEDRDRKVLFFTGIEKARFRRARRPWRSAADGGRVVAPADLAFTLPGPGDRGRRTGGRGDLHLRDGPGVNARRLQMPRRLP